jgi:hypothetical protein
MIVGSTTIEYNNTIVVRFYSAVRKASNTSFRILGSGDRAPELLALNNVSGCPELLTGNHLEALSPWTFDQ